MAFFSPLMKPTAYASNSCPSLHLPVWTKKKKKKKKENAINLITSVAVNNEKFCVSDLGILCFSPASMKPWQISFVTHK